MFTLKGDYFTEFTFELGEVRQLGASGDGESRFTTSPATFAF
jgi:hypothetical protein